jgi:3-oxoadipate enol-lactonase
MSPIAAFGGKQVQSREECRIHIAIEKATRPGAPWIVLANSLAADISMWDRQIPLLAGSFNVLRYDTRGHGRSDVPDGPYDMATLADDLFRVMDSGNVDKATVVGLSLGGMTGLEAAIRRPDRIERLVCCDARADMPAAAIEGWNRRIALVRDGGMSSIADETLDRWLSEPFRRKEPAATQAVRRMICDTPPSGYAGCAEAIKKLDLLDRLDAIEVPTYFIVGEDDVAAPVEAIRAMSARVRGSELSIVAGARHLPNIDSQPAFDRLLAGIFCL